MYYIGIDVGKFKHCACVIDSDGEVLEEPFFFPNTQEGFQTYLQNTKRYKSKKHLVGLEATGHYGDNLIDFLLDQEYEAGMINPLTTDAKRKGKIRKTKNDKKDTFLICSVLFDKDYTKITKRKMEMRQTREYTRLHAALTEDLNQKKNRLQKCIDIVIPEMNIWFKTKYSKMYMKVLKEFGSSYQIANAKLPHLKKVLEYRGMGKRIEIDAGELREKAKRSIGRNDEAVIYEMKILIETIEMIEEQIKEVDKKIEEAAKKLDSPIFSIPGIGIYTGMTIISEIGDIRDFSRASKVIGYAGVDPGTHESGEYNAPQTAITKRGSRYLRKALYQCILPVCKNEPTFKAYYKRKRGEGKSHRCAQGHCVRKLIRVVYKLCSEGIEFEGTKLV